MVPLALGELLAETVGLVEQLVLFAYAGGST